MLQALKTAERKTIKELEKLFEPNEKFLWNSELVICIDKLKNGKIYLAIF